MLGSTLSTRFHPLPHGDGLESDHVLQMCLLSLFDCTWDLGVYIIAHGNMRGCF